MSTFLITKESFPFRNSEKTGTFIVFLARSPSWEKTATQFFSFRVKGGWCRAPGPTFVLGLPVLLFPMFSGSLVTLACVLRSVFEQGVRTVAVENKASMMEWKDVQNPF